MATETRPQRVVGGEPPQDLGGAVSLPRADAEMNWARGQAGGGLTVDVHLDGFSGLRSLGLFTKAYPHRLVAVLRAYFDASETFGCPPVLVVAGFLGEESAWDRCQEQWHQALADCNLALFHMTDFEAQQAPPWDRLNDRDALLSRLVTFTTETAQVGAATVVRMDDYKALDNDTRRQVGKPFYLAACICIGVIARWCVNHGINEKVAYFFESGDMGLPAFADAVRRIVTASDSFRTAMKIHSVTTGSKRDWPLLQTADILAWEIGHHIPKRFEFEQGPIRPSLDRLLSIGVETEYLDGKALRAIAGKHTPEEYKRMADIFGIAVKRERRSRRNR